MAWNHYDLREKKKSFQSLDSFCVVCSALVLKPVQKAVPRFILQHTKTYVGVH